MSGPSGTASRSSGPRGRGQCCSPATRPSWSAGRRPGVVDAVVGPSAHRQVEAGVAVRGDDCGAYGVLPVEVGPVFPSSPGPAAMGELALMGGHDDVEPVRAPGANADTIGVGVRETAAE